MTKAKIDFSHTTSITFKTGHELCFQKCSYIYDDGSETEEGFRFIWKDPQGNLLPQRGQARIPSLDDLRKLVDQAIKEGWAK